MIISKTPLRMSFVGGGSDLPAFYREHGGAVLSMAIDKYIYITVNKRFDHSFRISYSRTEEVPSIDEVQHPLARECLRLTGCNDGIEVTSIADIPARGTGLGSSSSFVVGLLHALHAYCGRYVSAGRLAEEACRIEIEKCGEPIGKQDQYAAAFGGLNVIRFRPDERVDVEPVICRPEVLATLQSQFLTFYTGATRSASELLARQSQDVAANKTKQGCLQRMVELVDQARFALQAGNMEDFGALLDENWRLKASLTPGITNQDVDRWYRLARQAGAWGGKLLGAGQGGFLLVQAPVERHEAVQRALTELRHVPLRFERNGSQIIFFH
jgi:D-glycero-alpha-D-manno-heptose-7-phosphate kinase